LENKNEDIAINIESKNNNTSLFYIFSNNCCKKININIKDKQNTNSLIKCFCFANNNSEIIINITSDINNSESNNIQVIHGIILDDKSKITAVPSMIIKNYRSNSKHEVNLGYIDKEKLFFLTSKGISEKEAVNLLIASELNDIKGDEILYKKMQSLILN
jgi:Fe-S cluster assembly scaffold protein SufB